MIKKTGTSQKIRVIKESGFAIDPNLLAKQIKDKWTGSQITLDQLHEAVKSTGVTDYSSDDMSHLVELLQSSGMTVIG